MLALRILPHRFDQHPRRETLAVEQLRSSSPHRCPPRRPATCLRTKPASLQPSRFEDTR